MPSLNGTETEQNLKDAFARKSQANRCYLNFAQKADIEGFDEIAGWFETLAKAGTPHAGRFQKALDAL
ncbi:MAG TPA: ferritin family protein [Stellaceae bacterium]|nr:ferritin family protein [Stellaceae bacterium]